MKETVARGVPGFPLLFLVLAIWAGVLAAFVHGINTHNSSMVWSAVGGSAVAFLLSIGFFIVEPNGSKVLILSAATSAPSRSLASTGPTRFW